MQNNSLELRGSHGLVGFELPMGRVHRGYYWGYCDVYKSKNSASMRVAGDDVKDISLRAGLP